MQLKLRGINTKVKYTFDSHNVEGQTKFKHTDKMHFPPMGFNFCNKHINAVKQVIVQDHKRCTEYVAISNCMTTSYSTSKQA